MSDKRTDHQLSWVRSFFEQQIPFNRYLGLEIVDVEEGRALLRMPFRDELIGDPTRPALHGGSLSALADTAGGAAAFTVIEPGGKLSTIDLRVDYLRPGRPEEVWAEARVIRRGNRVVVARIQLQQEPRTRNSEDASLIAEATGVYSAVQAGS